MAKKAAYSDAFKAEALRRLAEDSIPCTTFTRELSVDMTTLRKWRKHATHQPSSTPRSSILLTFEEMERALEQSNALIKRQQMEIDILKKPWASSQGCPNEITVYHHSRPTTLLSATQSLCITPCIIIQFLSVEHP
jgi:transposase-like protein